MNEFLTTIWNGVKKIGLATFYGLRQCLFQLLCWEIFELIVNLMGFYLYGDHHEAFTVRWSAYLCIVVFTMLHHWLAMIIPSRERFARFVIPYIICVIGWLNGMVVVGAIVPFICLLFFLMESYLKKVLTPHSKAFKRIKVAYNCIFLIPLLLIALIRIDNATDFISRKRRFDDAETLTRVTEMYFPKFKVVEFYEDWVLGPNRKFDNELILEFKMLPTEDFYTVIDSIAKYADSGWSVEDDSTYYYSRTWGNGLPAPRGEDDNEDMSLSIQIKRGEKRFYVNYGASETNEYIDINNEEH
jgi:hypothetical protein